MTAAQPLMMKYFSNNKNNTDSNNFKIVAQLIQKPMEARFYGKPKCVKMADAPARIFQ